MLKLHVATLLADLAPAVGLQVGNDFSGTNHSVYLYTHKRAAIAILCMGLVAEPAGLWGKRYHISATTFRFASESP